MKAIHAEKDPSELEKFDLSCLSERYQIHQSKLSLLEYAINNEHYGAAKWMLDPARVHYLHLTPKSLAQILHNCQSLDLDERDTELEKKLLDAATANYQIGFHRGNIFEGAPGETILVGESDAENGG